MTYKRFPILTTSISAFLIAVFCLLTPASANEALFTVRDVTVDITAANALAAREQAFEQAQQKAFTQLMTRLSDAGQNADNTMPDPVTLAGMIKDYEVTSEKLSTVRYIGQYTFRFKSDLVKRYFSTTDLEYTDITSEPILILPFLKKDGEYDLWSYNNDWREAWDRTNSANALVPIVVPVGDIQDVRDIGDQDAENYNARGLRNILDRYDAKEAVIVIATPDAGFEQAQDASAPARGAISIDLYRTDKYGPEHVQQFFIAPSNNQTRAQTYDQAAKRVQKMLSQDWKEKTITAPQDLQSITAHIAISSLADWTQKQKILKGVAPIEAIKVQSLTPRKVTVSISFTGNEDRLRLALSRKNMNLNPVNQRTAPYEGFDNSAAVAVPEYTLTFAAPRAMQILQEKSEAQTPPEAESASEPAPAEDGNSQTPARYIQSF